MGTDTFTPGPWEFRPPTPKVENGDDAPMGGFWAINGDWVCHFGDDRTYYPEAGWPPREADARLIASAPEMYELLRELVDIEGPQPGHITWANKVFALLAKVRAGHWLPIASAPKDGTMVKIKWATGEEHEATWRTTNGGKWHVGDLMDLTWADQEQITGWKPLAESAP